MRSVLISLAITALVLFGALGAAFAGGGNQKVSLCHFPPGNPDNGHTITVSEKAVPAHLAHGDSLGECPTGYGYR